MAVRELVELFLPPGVAMRLFLLKTFKAFFPPATLAVMGEVLLALGDVLARPVPKPDASSIDMIASGLLNGISLAAHISGALLFLGAVCVFPVCLFFGFLRSFLAMRNQSMMAWILR